MLLVGSILDELIESCLRVVVLKNFIDSLFPDGASNGSVSFRHIWNFFSPLTGREWEEILYLS